MRVQTSLRDRLDARLARVESGCLEWQGGKLKGYGRISVDGRNQYVHRVAWVLERGDIPDGLMVDHLCHNPACAELSHLRLATRSQNGQNRSPSATHANTGARGVWRHPDGRLQVRVRLFGKTHYGGTFASLSDAMAAAADLRARLHDPVPSV